MSKAYKNAGVDIEAGYAAVAGMKKHIQRTMRPEVITGGGGFGGLFELSTDRYTNPVLVSGTDGVGTKLKIAFALKKHHTIGIDLVAMSVNDVLVQGAEPLFFMDYFATSKLDPDQVVEVVAGIAEGCVQAGCTLLGGETAELPGFYQPNEYDLAGFCVGVVDKEKLITGADIKPGDVILGLQSSGLHSNGFSLVRKLLIDQGNFDLNKGFDNGESLGDVLIKPTRIYVKSVLKVLEHYSVAGMAHITGGGFIENIPRILPDGCNGEISLGSWTIPTIFNLLQDQGELSFTDMFNTFNMGIGLVLVVKPDTSNDIVKILEDCGEKVSIIGRVTSGDGKVIFKEANQ